MTSRPRDHRATRSLSLPGIEGWGLAVLSVMLPMEATREGGVEGGVTAGFDDLVEFFDEVLSVSKERSYTGAR